MKLFNIFLFVLYTEIRVVFMNSFEEVCPTQYYTTSQNVTVSWSLEPYTFADLKDYAFGLFPESKRNGTYYASKSTEFLMRSALKSDPMCLNKDKLLVARECNKDGWQPPDPPNCTYTQTLLEHMSPCPEPFYEIKRQGDDFLCVLVSDPKEWDSDCVQWGVSDSVLHLEEKDFQLVRDYLVGRSEENFWLPLRSFGQFLPFLWHLPGGDNFGRIFDEDTFKYWPLQGDKLPEGNCLAISRKDNFKRIYVEDCKKNYSTICIYNEKKPHLQLACPAQSFTPRYNRDHDQCLSVQNSRLEKWKECNRPFVADTKDKIMFYREVRKEFHEFPPDAPCFGYFYKSRISDSLYWSKDDWIKHKDMINFVFWTPTLHSFEDFFSWIDFMALNSNGLWSIVNDALCEVCGKVMEMYPPELSVIFNERHQSLELVVYSGEFLWRRDDDDSGITCYTDADSTLLSNVKIKDLVWSDKIKTQDIIGTHNNFNREYITKSIYELDLEEDTPGNYWCEGISLVDYSVVRSASVIAHDDDEGTAFAFRTITDCKKCKQGFTKKELKDLTKDFHKLLEKHDHWDRIENAKIMKIEELPGETSKIEVIFHVYVEDGDFTHYKCPKNVSHHICALHKLNGYLEGLVRRASGGKKFQDITFRHTVYCLPYFAKETEEIQWMSATIGQKTTLQRLCLTTNLLPVYRFCTGDFIRGAKWDTDHVPACQEEEIPKFTHMLFDLDNSDKKPIEIIDKMQKITSVDSSDIIPADLYLMGSLTKRIAFERSNDSEIGFDEIEKIITIYSHTMEVDDTTAKASQILNSTNTLLDMNERIMNEILMNASISNKTISGQEANKLLGVIEVKAKNIMSYVIDPTVANVSGIALYRNGNNSSDFSDFYLEYLYANQSTLDLIEGRNDLEVATFVPHDLLMRINEINQTVSPNVTMLPKPPLRIVITVMASDRMFQENRNVSFYRANGRIVTVTIPGYGPNLPTFLPIVFHTTEDIGNGSQACGFWNFAPTDRDVYSEWSTTGCEFLSKSSSTDPPIVLCGCSHITNFAFLLTGVFQHELPPEELLIYEMHAFALDLITVLGCSLSLAGVVGIWITAIFFKTWREKAGSKVILHLSVGIAMQMLLFLFINAEYLIKDINNADKRIICITLGALLQYSVLVVFSWMLITAYLQYLRYVIVFGNPRPPHFTIKSIIVGWILPTIPVILVLGLAMDSYLPPNFYDEVNFREKNCYPHGTSLYFGVLLPVAVIFLANFAIYIAVIYSITRKMDKSAKKNDTKIQLAQFRLSVLLFFLLGMSWIFGFLVYTEQDGNLIFSYLFCLIATLQGFVLFAYFVIMDPATRKLWEQFFTSLRCGKSEKFT